MDLPRWQRVFITACNQDGKTFLGFVIPTMHMLFERKENVLLGVPSADMVTDKWRVDLLPAIRASKYRDLIPRSGPGSRGGDASLIEFGNGTKLRFMTAGGDDQSRAGFGAASRLMVTETDGFDEVGSSSREGDKFSQLERRLLAYGDQARLVAECTVSNEQGRTWQEYQRGSQSRIALPCPHCDAWVTPEREHLVGWQDAENEIEAIAKAAVACPECGALWSNDQRMAANHRGVLVHRGQEVTPDGHVVGPVPQTNTLGFRWTVVNAMNPKRLSLVAGLEWKAKRSVDEDTAELDLMQSQWVIPAKPAKLDVSQVDAMTIMNRTDNRYRRGDLPADTQAITVACDVNKRLLHWTAIAWRPRATPHILDYDKVEVPCDIMAEEDAILSALRSWRDEVVSPGWGGRPVNMTFVDAGNWRDTIVRFCEESGFLPAYGFGVSQKRGFSNRREGGSVVVERFDNYTEMKRPSGETIIEINVDYWKSWTHARIRTPIHAPQSGVEMPGALTLFGLVTASRGGFNDHLSFAKHLVSERETEEWVPGQGLVRRFEELSRNNHWLDSTMMACVAGHAVGVRLQEEPAADAAVPELPPDPNRKNFATSWRGRY